MKIGVLALQGAFAEHVSTLHAIGVEAVEVRLPEDLLDVDGLIIPGGESTTMRRLIDRWGLRQPILDLAETGAPLFGTCAGMIVLAREIAGDEEPVLPLLDVTVERNAFGRQLDSFETELVVPLLGDQPVHAVFIRAPVIERVGPGVDVIAKLDDGRIVAVRERNVIATAFHPELAGETRFHRLVAMLAAEHADPGEGVGRRPHPTRRAHRAGSDGTHGQGPRRTPDRSRRAGRAVPARAGRWRRDALARAPGDGAADRDVQPVPAAARGLQPQRRDVRVRSRRARRRPAPRRARQPSRRVDGGGARRGRRPRRRRRAVPAGPAPAARRRQAGAVRFHVACGDVDDNVELFMQAGFIRFGDEHILFREPDDPLPAPMADDETRAARIRPAASLDALPLSRLYASVTPAPVQRLENVRMLDWERQGRDWRVPRSSLAPILRFADVDAFVQETEGGGPDGTQLDAFVQIGVAKEDQPHYLKVMARPEADVVPLIRHALGTISAGADASGRGLGVLAPVRTYESPIDRRLEEEGFASIATVTLLMKETLVRVAEPRLVPAGVR